MADTAEWFDVTQPRENVYRIREGAPQLPCHSYLLVGGGDALLIDTGLGIGALRGLVEDLAGSTPAVMLTHAHWDHLGAAHEFDEVFVHPSERHPDGTVSLDVFEARFAHRPGIFLDAWRDAGRDLPTGFDPESYRIRPTSTVGTVEGGDRVERAGRMLEVVEVPGHSPGQVALIDRDAGIGFGGDVLEPGGTVYAHFAGCDLAAYRESLSQLIDLRDDGAFDVLLTGHGDPMTDLSVLDGALAALVAIDREELPYELVDTHWGRSRRYEHQGVTLLTAA